MMSMKFDMPFDSTQDSMKKLKAKEMVEDMKIKMMLEPNPMKKLMMKEQIDEIEDKLVQTPEEQMFE